MVSPCRTCAHVGRSKNHPDCVNCHERQAAFDGTMTLEAPVTTANGETKICSDPDCPHSGQPQPIEVFRRARYGRLKICSDCMRRKMQAGKKSVKAKAKQDFHGRYSVPDDVAKNAAKPANPYMPKTPADKPAPPVKAETAPPSNRQNTLVIDFAGHRDLLDGLRRRAEANLRTPENMLLYLVKQCVESIDALDRG